MIHFDELCSIFFKWVGSTTNQKPVGLDCFCMWPLGGLCLEGLRVCLMQRRDVSNVGSFVQPRIILMPSITPCFFCDLVQERLEFEPSLSDFCKVWRS